MVEQVKQFLVLLSSVGVILVNYLSQMGDINGIKLEAVSDKYLTLITPASYAFSGWRVLSVALIIFSVFQFLPSTRETLSRTRTFYILACLANILIIYSWHSELFWASVIPFLVALFALVKINTDKTNIESPSTFWFEKIPLSIFFAWTSLLFVLNLAIIFISSGIETSRISSFVIASAVIVAVTAIGIVIRHKISTFAYTLTIAWGITATAVKQSGKTAIIVVCALCVIALLISTLSFFVQDQEKTV